MYKTLEEQIGGFLCNAQGNIKAVYIKGYKNGLNDAWECAKKIYEFSGKELSEIFPKSEEIPFYSYSASEAMARIKEYEDKKAERNASPDNELHIGDEVYILDKNRRATVTALLDNGNKANLLCTSGNYLVVEISELHKTGRRFAIDEVLRELKE